MAEKKETTLRSAFLQKILLAVIAGIGWYALSLQFYLMVQNSDANNYVRNVNNILRRNRRILEELNTDSSGKTKVS